MSPKRPLNGQAVCLNPVEGLTMGRGKYRAKGMKITGKWVRYQILLLLQFMNQTQKNGLIVK